MLAQAVPKQERDLIAAVAAKEDAVREPRHDRHGLPKETSRTSASSHSENALERDRAERDHHLQSEQIVNLNNRGDAIRAEIASTRTAFAKHR